VLQEPKDADVGSILGLGFPIHTGGVMSYIDYIGAKEFALYSTKLEAKYGDRFKMPESLQNELKAGTCRVSTRTKID
jgi:3-hydroxyacyl-CoA dehydrogenase/enoyl-CoA hydratase/3-hydroxybutyryl-CoA epimerase